MNLVGFIRELRRRRVFRAAAVYIVAAWAVLQVADLAFQGLGIPGGAIRSVWIGVFAGFPLALIFGWRYEITADGIVRTAPMRADATADLSLKWPDYATMAALVAVAGAVVYQLVGQVLEVREPTQAARGIHPHSIAVLPLDNLTGDPDQEYFVAGMHDALIADLSRISALRVISRTSTNAYKDTATAVPAIAQRLRVANVVEGSVFRTGDRVRLTIQLIDAATDEHRWADSFERELKDLIALQAELARTIARQIQVTLTPDEEFRLTSLRQVDPDVYVAYLKGMFLMKQLTAEGTAKGLQYLHEAIAADPREPLAYAGLALGYNTIGHGVDSHGAFPKAIAAARKALELDEYSGEAWAALAEAQMYYQWDWQASERSFQRALQLSPSLDHAHAHYAYLLTLYGRMEEAIAEVEKARELSPLDGLWTGFAAWLYMLEDRPDDVFALTDECLGFAPRFPLCLYTAAQMHLARGALDEAIAAGEELPPGTPYSNWVLGPAYAMAGRADDARRIAAAMAGKPTPKDMLHLAFTYVALGDTEEAFRWFTTSYENRVDWLPWIARPNAYGGVLESLRDHPDFQALVGLLNLPEE
jgi:TolB-like protein